MAGALLSAIVERLGSLISSEFKLTVTVKEEVQKLQTKFRTIQAVLNDAEKRQLKEEAVKLWVDKLEGVSDEIDNVLDEWNTVMIKAEIEKQQKEFEEEENAETSTAKKRKERIGATFLTSQSSNYGIGLLKRPLLDMDCLMRNCKSDPIKGE
ncbi:hypothetical protein CMV_025668 [Castanea mollissima]|uniref:Disease resistance N-terminal domain-containing protein n=1 Tax=Castanea mollissima TaxID=60419 RepID=A0A8J4QL76_9ROSI|nr:hypothetical protein CMV_025668 [Castanea mollissima]